MSQRHESREPRVEFDLHFRPGLQGRRELADGPAPEPPAGREELPRVTKLLALAHRWDDLLERGEFQNQAEIARLMGITEARVSQIMYLAYLAPVIQEQLLEGPPDTCAREASELRLRAVGADASWAAQVSCLPSYRTTALQRP